jgi:hypothetical protein
MNKDILIGVLLTLTFILCIYLTMFVFFRIDLKMFEMSHKDIMDGLELMRDSWKDSEVEDR